MQSDEVEQQQGAPTHAPTETQGARPRAGFVIAGAALLALFGLAALKGRVKDQPTGKRG